MHFAVVEINLHIGHAAAGDDAFSADLRNTFLDGGHEIPVHVLPDERLCEFHAAVARLRLDAHPDFGELARAAGLFFVAVFGFAFALDRLTIFHARLGEVDMDVVSAAQTVGDDFQMQFTLRGNDRLVQLAVHDIKKRRVFLVQRGEAGGDLILLAFHAGDERGVDVRLGINHLRQRHRMFQRAERVAGVRVLELHHRADVARTERVDGLAGLAVEQKIWPTRSVILRSLLNKSVPVVTEPE